MALRILLMILASFCLAATGQEGERKNIKMLFVPAEVMKALRSNLTTKDLPPGLPGQSSQHWSPVRLPGDKTHTFEIRINPRAAQKLKMNFQHFKVGRGHGLLLELKNVSLSTKGKTVLDRLVEFYKNCGGERNPRIGMHMMHRIRRPHPTLKHSLLLPGDVPLLKRIQSALERFFPRRHDGSVDVFQHKDPTGAVHFLPFEEVRREVNNLIKRTLVKRDCVKISTDALTRALDAFRRKLNNDTTTSNQNESVDVSNEADSENNENNREDSDNEDEEKEQVLSFSRNLDSLNPYPVNKVNLTSSSAINVPSDAKATKIVSALAYLRKEINYLSSGFKQKVIPNSDKDSNNTILDGSMDDNAAGSNANIVKNMSSDNNETKDEKNANLESFDISEVKNRPKNMSSDGGDDLGNNNNNNNINNEKGISIALKMKNIEDDLKSEPGKDLLKLKRNVSKIAGDSTSVNSPSNGQSKEQVTNARPVNQAVNPAANQAVNQAADQAANHLQPVKVEKEVKVSKNLFAHTGHSDETKKINKQARIKDRRERARHRKKHRHRVRDRKIRKCPSVLFHYKPKSLRLKHRYIDGEYVKADDGDDEDESVHRHRGKGRFVHLSHMRRRHPKIKEMPLPDEQDESAGYRERKFDDSPVETGEDKDNMKVRLLRKLRWLRIHGRTPKIRNRKSPKLRVVVYDDEEEEKPLHHDSWRGSEADNFAEKMHDDDSETESESDPEPEPEPSAHRSEPVYMDDENTQQENQEETNNKFNSSPENDSGGSDMQYLSDSIGDDSTHLGRSDSEADVPNLEPYLKKNYENEEDEENEEIKMYNDQDGIDVRKLGDSMEKRINKTPKEDDTILDEKAATIDDSYGEEPERIHIHKIPFKIQEDSDGVDASLLKEPQHDALGLQQVLSRGPDMSSMASQPFTLTSSFSTANQNAMDMSPNMVMPQEQSMMIPAVGALPQMNGAMPGARPNLAAYTGINYYQPSVTTQMNSMMPQTPFPQVSSMMPMQTGASEISPMIPVMQPGQMRAVIYRGQKTAPKGPGSKKHLRHIRVSGIENKYKKFSGKVPDKRLTNQNHHSKGRNV